MKKVLVFVSLFIGLMSFTSINKKTAISTGAAREKHIDITVTATNGCTIHVVGDVSYTIVPPRVQGFQGTVTIGGGSNCPHTTLTINWANKTPNSENAGLEFDTDITCDITTATWYSTDQSTTDLLNDERFNIAFISEVKSGLCDN